MNSYITPLVKQYNFILKNLSFDQQKQIYDYQLLIINVNNSKITRLQLKPLEEITDDTWAVIEIKEYSREQLEKDILEYSKKGVNIRTYEYNLITAKW